MIHTLDSTKYRMLECFIKSKDNRNGIIKVTDAEGKAIDEKAGQGYYRWIKIPLERESKYQIEVMDAEVSVAYLSGNDDVMEEGVAFVDLDNGAVLEGKAIHDFYDTPYREQYHFNPFKNWVNDPNGVCWFKGYYHLYFQANPHKQEWNNMYWGHAVSRDLVHWKHLPYVLQPQDALYQDMNLKGGAFSGSAVVRENEVYFYLTRHEGPQEDGPLTKEWQTMTCSRDMLTFDREKVVVEEKPAGAGHDFRDPKVFEKDGKWYMVLASNLNGKSTILLYHSEDMKSWSYVGPLVTEEDKGSTTFECPDCFALDGKYVAVGALMRHYDEHGRYQMTRYYIGEWKEEHLEVESFGWYDFGSNFYAVQSFEHEGKRIAIGWISDFYQEHIEVEDGAYGSYAIPRVLSLKDNKLYMEPVTHIYDLKDECLYDKPEQQIILNNIEGNSYFAEIDFKNQTDFKIVIGRDGEKEISLLRSKGITELKTVGVKSEKVCFPAETAEVNHLEIFVDRRVVEVFVNHGESAGTKLFYNTSKQGVFEAEFEIPDSVEKIEVYSMKSIWGR